jgi:hypothetical protein
MKHRPSPLGIAFCLSLVTSAGIVGYRSTNSPSGQRILIIVDFEPVMPHEMPHQLTNPKPQNQR